MSLTPEQILEVAVKSIDDRQAEDIMALDVRQISILADYFVVCHGTSNRQIQALSNGLIRDAQEAGIEVKNVEGKESTSWTLVDLGDVIVHIFSEEDRSFYNLEKLWTDADLVNIAPMIAG